MIRKMIRKRRWCFMLILMAAVVFYLSLYETHKKYINSMLGEKRWSWLLVNKDTAHRIMNQTPTDQFTTKMGPKVKKQKPPDLLNATHFSLTTWMSAENRKNYRSKVPLGKGQLKELQLLCENEATFEKSKQSNFCPCFSEANKGYVEPDLSPPSWDFLAEKFHQLGVELGGHHIPRGCYPRQKVAIVFMYRDRGAHLHVQLKHLHTILVRQNMEYQIFVVEQAYPRIFNRAALLDIGFLEAKKMFNFDCIITHDVDLLMEDDRDLYACYTRPRHFTSHIEKQNYGTTYAAACGGVAGFPKDIFEKLNGFAYSYWGWGGEDDNMFARIKTLGLTLHRNNASVERFTVIKHEKNRFNPYNVHKGKMLQISTTNMVISKDFPATMKQDGLSTFKYKVHAVERRPLFTWIYAEPLSVLSNFTVEEGACKSLSETKRVKSELVWCANKCSIDTKCRGFSFQYDKSWASFCQIIYTTCKAFPEKKSFIYYKGRTVDL